MRPHQPRFKKAPPKSRDGRSGGYDPRQKSEGRDRNFKPRERSEGRDRDQDRDKPRHKSENRDRDFKPRTGRDRDRDRDRNFKPRDRNQKSEGFKPRERSENRDRDFKPREERGGDFKPRQGFKPRNKEGYRDDFKPRFKKEPRTQDDSNALRLFGVHAVAAAWRNPKRRITRALFTAPGRKQMEDALNRASVAKIQRPKEEIVEAYTIDKMLPRGAVHQGIMIEVEELAEMPLDDILKDSAGAGFVVVLDQVTDPHNVGAVLRTACAFGAKAVLMTDRHAAAATGTLAKSASGGLDNIALIRITNLAQTLADLQKAEYWCIGLAEEGKQNLHEIKMPSRVALVLGAEGEGLRRLTRESCDEIARLPTGGAVGSLNVSNAAAVAIYEVSRQKI
jgi:23S rRNA (guanosine2251-2'-O)-methyltransferase